METFFHWVLEKVTEKTSEKLLEYSGYDTSWIGLSGWKGNKIKKQKQNKRTNKQKNLGIISRSTSCQMTILLLFFNFSFRFVWCKLSMCGITECYRALIDSAIIQYSGYAFFFLLYIYSYNRSKQSAECQAAIVLLKREWR